MTLLRNLWFGLVSVGFYLLYHQLAPTYDVVSWIVSFGKWRIWQQAGLPYLKGTDVLELAHGPGHMLLAMQRAGFRVTGCDLSPQMGQLAQKKLMANTSPITIVQTPAQTLPFASESFDSVLSTFPTEFISEQATLQEVFRVLREGGRFVIVPQARLTGGSVPVRLVESLYQITGQRNVPGTSTHENPNSNLFRRFCEQANSAGFEYLIEEVAQNGSEITVFVATKTKRLS